MNEQTAIVNNTEKMRFEMAFENGETAFVEYKLTPGKISLIHTDVPKDLEGKGIAGALAKYALDFARNQHLRINIYCSYIAAYVKRHPEYDDIIDHTIS